MELTFKEWLAMTVSGFVTGGLFALGGYLLTVFFPSGMPFFLGWVAIVMGIGAFLIASGILPTVMFFATIAAFFINPIAGIVCAVITLLVYGIQVNWVEQVRSNTHGAW